MFRSANAVRRPFMTAFRSQIKPRSFASLSSGRLFVARQKQQQQQQKQQQQKQQVALLHSQRKAAAPKMQLPQNDLVQMASKQTSQFVQKLRTSSATDLMHMTSKGLVVAFPLGLLLSPSFLCVPIDFAMGVVVPIHAHIGMTYVIDDYVPRGSQTAIARGVLLFITLLMLYGLLKVNLCGPGISESVKALWRKPAKKE
eukprot:TRINITY_DN66936_c7_g1_i1.p1 TRINITY_DN66936_c7_g1~~TRINITY_DN66936_c7_g1_i1.p1  ORF type:complete len:199 (+),score=91.76 TRINITY_DN66936_c7_g1_i1:70-666(+)